MIGALQPDKVARETGGLSPKAVRGSTLAPFSSVFDGVLRACERFVQPIRFSNHALQRMEQRGVTLSDTDLSRIEQATQEAASKGGRESLLLMNQAVSQSERSGENRLALLLSVPNRTVITVVPQTDLADAVFTNIDSAVVVADASPSPKTTSMGWTPAGEARVPSND